MISGGPGCRAAWAAANCGSERSNRHGRDTARRRQSSLAGRRSRTPCSTSIQGKDADAGGGGGVRDAHLRAVTRTARSVSFGGTLES